MKKQIVLILLAIAPAFVVAQDCRTTDAKSFGACLEDSNCTIVDVRTEREFAGGHVPNAVNIDFYGDDFRQNLLKLDKSKPVYVYCYGGGRSGEACEVLTAQGFKVIDLENGLKAWKEAGLPVEK
jgi:rhodanese-related sulfurtransferase